MPDRSRLTRRRLLWAGGAVALVAAAGGIWTVETLTAPPRGLAYEPWELWNDPAVRGTPLALVAAGILAANPHDTQPWLFRVSDTAIEVSADTARHLGAMDPFLREMHIGIGCAIENMMLAAGPNGYAADLDVLPGSLIALTERRAPARAATIRLSRLSAPAEGSPLYRAIPLRHTNRYAYDRAKPLPARFREEAASLSTDPAVRLLAHDSGQARPPFDAAILEATQAIIEDAQMIADSDRWFRTSRAEIEAYRSGPTLDASGLSPLALVAGKLVPLPASASHAAWLAQTRDVQLPTAPTAGLIAVHDRYDRGQAIAAGRVWQRLHLAATLAGIAMQPLNQAVEMVDRERELGRPPIWEKRMADLAEAPDWQPTFAFRAGISTKAAPPSPRRALGDVIVR
jgi:hypothetical protein